MLILLNLSSNFCKLKGLKIWEDFMLEKLRLTVLSENRVTNPKLIAEQGLSILVETADDSVLFDTGQTDALLYNAKNLGVDLSRVTKVVQSHGHFDMTGGLKHLVQQFGKKQVYCHPNLFNKKFNIIDQERVNIGVPWEKAELESMGTRFILKTHPMEISPDIWISGEIPRLTDYEYIDETYQERVLESFIHDQIHDDMSLIIKTTKGLIILMGCGHAGPVNTAKHAMRISGMNHIHAIVGGMHLHRAPDEKIEKIVNNLIKLNPGFIIPLHCCGFRSINLLYNQLKDRVLLFNVGDTFELNWFL
jgi:7,8-dihydropterin-6-yl-methyl-4-(beta-D-ribofuranosyl)aminobenzene 5'-phosphate synthase